MPVVENVKELSKTKMTLESNQASSFYVVAKEPGAEHPALPTWASTTENPLALSIEDKKNIEQVSISNVPGAFQLLNVLNQEECNNFISQTESLGYLQDAPVSLPRSVRHNDNVTWVVDEQTDGIIWQRVKEFLNKNTELYARAKPLGINARFRFYRYGIGDFFKTHTDGSWPGSRVINGELIGNAYPDRWSQMTFLIFLSDDFKGGSTQFLVDKNVPDRPARDPNKADIINVRTPAGSVLCFPHGQHPMHCLHGSELITSGTKYIIRTDVLFEI